MWETTDFLPENVEACYTTRDGQSTDITNIALFYVNNDVVKILVVLTNRCTFSQQHMFDCLYFVIKQTAKNVRCSKTWSDHSKQFAPTAPSDLQKNLSRDVLCLSNWPVRRYLVNSHAHSVWKATETSHDMLETVPANCSEQSVNILGWVHIKRTCITEIIFAILQKKTVLTTWKKPRFYSFRQFQLTL